MIVVDYPHAEQDIRHGIDGWVLEDMTWDPDTGVSTFEYSNTQRGGTWVIQRPQPTEPDHVMWLERPFQNVLSLT